MQVHENLGLLHSYGDRQLVGCVEKIQLQESQLASQEEGIPDPMHSAGLWRPLHFHRNTQAIGVPGPRHAEVDFTFCGRGNGTG